MTYDGQTFKRLAAEEMVVLEATPDHFPLSGDRCEALQAGSELLRHGEGSRSINAPFFAGSKIPEVALRMTRLASICRELVSRDADVGVLPDLRDRNRHAWRRAWESSVGLLGGAQGA